MDLNLSDADREIQARARTFAEEVLFPLEIPLEEAHGDLPAETLAEVKRKVVEHGLNAYNQAEEYGGQGFTILQQILCQEELGKATSGLW
ncbi:MAG: acyl-CoA/acyl-ACP dehydrogenase, partial [Rhodospirillaceae bacterium]|nr:acyl-CoA/acyl-ACP dehydrogenase [Rhodospirillaceae bacterium]